MKKNRLFLIVVFLFLLTACVHVPGDKLDPITEDIAEKAPGSLGIEVISFNWFYINAGTHIRVVGKVRNNTDVPYQSLIISSILHDEKGAPVMQGSSYIGPTYLKPGAEGSFEFAGITKRDRGIKAIRLVSTVSPTTGANDH